MTVFPAPLRLAIVNDYEVIVAGLAAVLSAHDPLIRVIELDSRVPSISDVDVVLLDTFAFAAGGLIEVRELVSDASRDGAKVVVYSWVTDRPSIDHALAQGAAGYVWKGLGASELIAALDAIRSGQVVVRAPEMSLVVDEESVDPDQARWPGRDSGLSAREAEVLALIAKGMSNEHIAGELFLGLNTIKTYIRSAYRKMGVTSRTQAVLWAVHHGFGMQAKRTVLDIQRAALPDRPEQQRPPVVPTPAWHSPARSAELAAELARRAAQVRTLVPRCVGITLASTREREPFTVVATSDEVAVLDAVQYLAGGPCVAAAEAGAIVTCGRAELDEQPSWRSFAAATSAADVTSTLSLPITADGRVVGTVNLYADTDDAFDGHQSAIAAHVEGWAARAAADARLPQRRVAVENMTQHLGDDLDIKRATDKIARDRAVPLQQARGLLDNAAHRAGVTKAELSRTVLGLSRH